MYKQLEVARAFLLGTPEARPPVVRNEYIHWKVYTTLGGLRVAVPWVLMHGGEVYNLPIKLAGMRLEWPVLPLDTYCGGWATGTAVWALKYLLLVRFLQVKDGVEFIRRHRSCKTANRVFWMDRRHYYVHVDVLGGAVDFSAPEYAYSPYGATAATAELAKQFSFADRVSGYGA
jgi:hypothetical protein